MTHPDEASEIVEMFRKSETLGFGMSGGGPPILLINRAAGEAGRKSGERVEQALAQLDGSAAS